MAPLQVRDECVAIYLSGSKDVNGLYCFVGREYAGFKMFRKIGSNMGLLRFDDGKLYISDCGPEFQPSGPDHLDFYLSQSKWNPPSSFPDFTVGEDGTPPAPMVKFVTTESLRTLISALRAQAHRYVSGGERLKAIRNLGSVISFPQSLMTDYLTLCQLWLDEGNQEEAWSVIITLTRNKELLFNDSLARYTKEQRSEISRLLFRSCTHDHSVSSIVTILNEKSLYPFVEFIIPLCEELKQKMDLEKFNPNAFDDSAVDKLVRVAEERRMFQATGGVEIAMNLRELYRNIDSVTFDQRDTSVNRMKIFSLTDSFRQYASDGMLDIRGRDGTFKSFWEAGTRVAEQETLTEIDPREQDARIKDLDPAKESKCSVIKAINDSKESEDMSGFFTRRSELLATAPATRYTLSDIQKCDCNNSELKLISIHSIVFDVTHNLEKYAPDGEYFFFPGHDISYPLAVSSLSGDHVDELYRLERPEHLKRVYGWMEYFVNKYEIVGRLEEYKLESTWSLPPQGEEEPDMQCTVM